jgi:hypothetical protein
MSGSGIAFCSPSIVISTQGTNQSASGTCTSVAGDVSAPASIAGINIDKKKPTIEVTTPPNGATYQVGTVIDASFTCSDSLSGIAKCAGSIANGSPLGTAKAGTKTFEVTATDMAGNAQRVTYSYIVTAASFSLSPGDLAFGTQALHVASAAQKVTVKNTGMAALPINTIEITGTNEQQFSQTHNCGSSLAVGATCTISVVFTPASAGSKTANLDVIGGDGAGVQKVPLSGTGS